MSVEVIVKWKVKEGQLIKVVNLLNELVERTKSEPGNELYIVYKSSTDTNVLILHEKYKDAAAAEAHRQTEHYRRIVQEIIIPLLEVREVNVVEKLL